MDAAPADLAASMTSAPEAARQIVQGIEKGSYRVVIGKDARGLDRLSRFSPQRATDLIAKKMASLLAHLTRHTGSDGEALHRHQHDHHRRAAERVHALVNDFHEWQQWSPWEDLDPQMRRTYSGPDAGVGAAYAWEGNRKAGQGRHDHHRRRARAGRRRPALREAVQVSRTGSRFRLTPAGDATTTRSSGGWTASSAGSCGCSRS